MRVFFFFFFKPELEHLLVGVQVPALAPRGLNWVASGRNLGRAGRFWSNGWGLPRCPAGGECCWWPTRVASIPIASPLADCRQRLCIQAALGAPSSPSLAGELRVWPGALHQGAQRAHLGQLLPTPSGRAAGLLAFFFFFFSFNLRNFVSKSSLSPGGRREDARTVLGASGLHAGSPGC